MPRRIVLRISALLLAVLLGMLLADFRAADRATAQAPVKLKMQASWPPASYAQLVVNGRQTMFPSYDFAANSYWKKR